jgi:NAD(P)H-nitrite reductase large subunit
MHVLIIGNGIAGITAARTIRKNSDCAISVLSAESEYFFSRTALMYVYMGHMQWQDIQPYESWFWAKNKITLIHDLAISFDHVQKTVLTSGGQTLAYDKLIMATGSSSNKLDIPGADLDGVASLYSRQDLEYIESKTTGINHAVIVGGGLIGIELAEMMHSRGIPVTMIVRESSYSNVLLPAEESAIINREIRQHGITLHLSTEVTAIKGDENGMIKSVITTTGQKIECQFAGISIGVHPNVSWLKDTPLAINQGILVNASLESNLPDIYAIGDCAELRDPPPGRRSIEPVWYTGRIMGETVAHTICGKTTKYNPGPWFNSAKFFNIEYQVYGDIRPQLAEGHNTVYWQHPDGQKSIRINYTDTGVVGFTLIGMRFRQVVCEKWIVTGTPVDDVLASLELAFFDPEFSPNYASRVRDVFEKMTGQRIVRKGKRNHRGVFNFLNTFSKPTA